MNIPKLWFYLIFLNSLINVAPSAKNGTLLGRLSAASVVGTHCVCALL